VTLTLARLFSLSGAGRAEARGGRIVKHVSTATVRDLMSTPALAIPSRAEASKAP
jgi:hypothetical protein